MPRLFVCTPTHSLQGGVERILESLAALLPRHGFEVVFGLARGARFHDPDRFRRAFPNVTGVDVDGTSGTAFGRRRALRQAVLDVDPDIVLIARMFDAYPVCSELKLHGHRLRLAVTVQAYESEYIADVARYAEFVDLCVTSGELVARAVRTFTRVGDVRSIPGGVEPARVPQTSAGDALRIAYAGRLEQVQKRILDLPLLADELRRRGVPFTLDIAGDGSAAAALAARLPYARFHGWLDHDALYERVYPNVDVLVHFAEWEGITIAPREAMAHGAVPVVSQFTGMKAEAEFVDGVNALTFPVGDVAVAADRIEALHRDRALMARLRDAARRSQEGIRSAEGAAEAWAIAFHDTLARPGRVGPALPNESRDRGRLARLGVPDTIAEPLRRLRAMRHADPGGEWPHWSGIRDEALFEQLARFARD